MTTISGWIRPVDKVWAHKTHSASKMDSINIAVRVCQDGKKPQEFFSKFPRVLLPNHDSVAADIHFDFKVDAAHAVEISVLLYHKDGDGARERVMDYLRRCENNCEGTNFEPINRESLSSRLSVQTLQSLGRDLLQHLESQPSTGNFRVGNNIVFASILEYSKSLEGPVVYAKFVDKPEEVKGRKYREHYKDYFGPRGSQYGLCVKRGYN